MKSIALLSALCAGLAAALPAQADIAPDFAPVYAAYVDTLRASCAEFENGEMDAPDDAVMADTDFNGDGIADPLVDESRFACSTSATLFSGGTGGGAIQVFASKAGGGYDRFAFQGLGYRVVEPLGKGNPVLMLPVHGSQCEQSPGACYAAYVWSDDGRFVSPGGAVAAAD